MNPKAENYTVCFPVLFRVPSFFLVDNSSNIFNLAFLLSSFTNGQPCLIKWSDRSLTIDFPFSSLPRNIAWKWSLPCGLQKPVLTFVSQTVFLPCIKRGKPYTFPECKHLFILYEANHFALMERANKCYTRSAGFEENQSL